jgi:chloride channel protein, CIC family
MLDSISANLKRFATRLGFEPDSYLIVFAAAIGLLTALGAFGFIHALQWLDVWTGKQQGHLSIWLLGLIPMAGALVTGILVHKYAAAAKGHGVPQVMDAIIRRSGKIPTRVGVVKVIASICSVGTGGSAGAEGPIVQIGATVGSVIGRRFHIPQSHWPTLVGCGAAAGIASVFNAPIAGVFFVLEIMLRDFSMRTFTPIVIASVFSATTTHALQQEWVGDGAGTVDRALFAFNAGENYTFTFLELPSYVVLGVLCALIAVGFTKLLHWGEDVYEKLPIHPIIQPVTGAAILGLLGVGYVFIAQSAGSTEHVPSFFGNGYAAILSLLNPASYAENADSLVPMLVWMLALVCLFKALGTVATLASGGSGGVFAPSLFMGAAAGASFGILLEKLGLPGGNNPASFALVGMAAVVSGATFAPLTAILILLELTHEPLILLPVMLASMVSTILARAWMHDSIYTMKLRQAGLMIGTGRDLTVLRKIPVTAVRKTPLPAEQVYAADPLSKLITLHASHNVPDFVVVDQEGKYMGMVTGAEMRTALIDREAIPLLLVAELLNSNLPTLEPGEMLDSVMNKFAKQDVASLCLVDADRKPICMITRGDVMKRYQAALQEH